MDTLYFGWVATPVDMPNDLELPQFKLDRWILHDCSSNYTSGKHIHVPTCCRPILHSNGFLCPCLSTSISLSVCLSVCISLCLSLLCLSSASLFVCLSLSVSLCLSACLSLFVFVSLCFSLSAEYRPMILLWL